MKYYKHFNSPYYKKTLKRIRKKYYGKARQRKIRQMLKKIDFEINNSDYKKIYNYGIEEVY
jgi:hypothetical protein